MNYSVAVIGCGVIGHRLGNAFNKYHGTSVKYAVDTNQEKLDSYCKIFSCTGFTDYRQVLDTDVDIVYVGVPPKWHHRIVLDALQADKHVICEKPLALSAEDGREMAREAKAAGVVTAVNFPFRYTPSFVKLRTMINQFDRINQVEIRIRMPRWPRAWQDVKWLLDHDQGGPLREIGSHFIYAVYVLFGPLEVNNKSVVLTRPGKFEKEVQAEFVAGGIHGVIDLITLDEEDEENTLYIRTPTTTLRYRNWHILERMSDGDWELVDDRGGNNSLQLVEQVATAINSGKGDLVSFEEGSEVQAVIDAIFDN